MERSKEMDLKTVSELIQFTDKRRDSRLMVVSGDEDAVLVRKLKVREDYRFVVIVSGNLLFDE